jgi:AraC-like DNA-binding protein
MRVSSELVTRRPAPSLRSYVRAYHGWTEETPAPIRRSEFSYGDVVLVVNLDAPVRVRDPRRPGHVVAPRAFVAGIDDSFGVTEHDGVSAGIQVTLSPLGARAFLGVPLHELAHTVVELEDVLGASARRIVERLQEDATWEERLARVETVVAERVAAGASPPPDAEWAWKRLNETHGALRVEALARELGCSRRHLAARFRDHVGLPPKTVARILRFRRAVRLMLRDTGRWGDIAAACGYCDQPHLNRDFQQFVGATPTTYLRHAASVTYLQDEADAAA